MSNNKVHVMVVTVDQDIVTFAELHWRKYAIIFKLIISLKLSTVFRGSGIYFE